MFDFISDWFKWLLELLRISEEKEVIQEDSDSKPADDVFVNRGLPDFKSMSKLEIDDWAAANGIELDRRKKKEKMIDDLFNNLNN